MDGKKLLRESSSKIVAAQMARFFKTGPGQYGEGDLFLGVSIPKIRKISLGLQKASNKDLTALLESEWHEDRLLALLILVAQYQSLAGDLRAQEKIVKYYLRKRNRINNWDLVDLTAYKILGDFSFQKQDPSTLLRLVSSKRHWDRRIAMVATFAYIRRGHTQLTFLLAKGLLKDTEDLMHKAAGWMLREAGKKDLKALRSFVGKFGSKMPRTMLRYAIERFPNKERQKILKNTSASSK